MTSLNPVYNSSSAISLRRFTFITTAVNAVMCTRAVEFMLVAVLAFRHRRSGCVSIRTSFQVWILASVVITLWR